VSLKESRHEIGEGNVTFAYRSTLMEQLQDGDPSCLMPLLFIRNDLDLLRFGGAYQRSCQKLRQTNPAGDIPDRGFVGCVRDIVMG
jgi:hypothetical protein